MLKTSIVQNLNPEYLADTTLLGTNFSEIKEPLYTICQFYCLHKLPYLKKPDGIGFSYIDQFSSQSVMTDTLIFDCFGFVWFVLKKLTEQGVIASDIEKWHPTYDTRRKRMGR